MDCLDLLVVVAVMMWMGIHGGKVRQQTWAHVEVSDSSRSEWRSSDGGPKA